MQRKIKYFVYKTILPHYAMQSNNFCLSSYVIKQNKIILFVELNMSSIAKPYIHTYIRKFNYLLKKKNKNT